MAVEKTNGLRELLGISASTECEFQLQDNPVCYRLAVFRCWLELRLTRRFDCLFGKSIWKPANDSDRPHITAVTHKDPQGYSALNSTSTSCLGVSRSRST